LKFGGGFFRFSQLTKSDGQFEVRGRVICDGLDGCAKLRDGSGQIARVAQATAGVGGKEGGLLGGFLFGEFGAEPGLVRCALGVAELAKNCSQSGMSTGEIRLKA
jgi:hypothetical protein